MAQLTYLSDTPALPVVYIACAPNSDEEYRQCLIDGVDAIRECRVCYADRSQETPERVLPPEDAQLILLPLDFSLLSNPPKCLEDDVQFAREHYIPLLPVLMEPGIREFYTLPQHYGNLPYLQYEEDEDTYISFQDALSLALRSMLIPQKLMEEAADRPEKLPKGSRRDLLMGIAQLAGLGMPKDAEMAFRLLHKAANAGEPEAAVFLLRAYCIGIGVPKNERIAFHYGKWLLQHIQSQEAISQWEQQLDFLVDLAYFYIRMEYPEKSVEVVTHLYFISKRHLGKQHPTTRCYTDLLTHLCRRYVHNEGYVAELCREQYETHLEQYGDHHSATLRRRAKAAMASTRVGEPLSSLRELSTIYYAYCSTLGEDSLEAMHTLYQVASVCHDMKEDALALKICDQLRRRQLNLLGRHAPSTMRTLQLLARIHISRKDESSALRWQRQLYLACRRNHSPVHPLTLQAQWQLATLLKSQDHKASALDHMNQVRDAYRNFYGADHALTQFVTRILNSWNEEE